jgi:hypothetical protein
MWRARPGSYIARSPAPAPATDDVMKPTPPLLPPLLPRLLPLLLIAACAAPPAPPPARPPAPAATAPAPAPPARPAPPPVATPQPVLPGAVSALPAAVLPAAPYNEAVAARFPEPKASYRTPAFQPGRTGFTTNAELAAALRALVRDGTASGGTTVRLAVPGTSQTGQPIEALVFARGSDGSPAALAASAKPLVLMIGQQHGDEPAGAEGLLAVAQELAAGRPAGVLDRINVVILPRANPDGADRNSRVSASGIDINRDHLLLRTPEAQAIATLVRDYRPMVVVDAHEHTVVGRYLDKYGAIQRFDALLQYAMTANLPPFVGRASDEWFHQPLRAALQKEGLTTEWYYTTSTDLADRKLAMGGVQPDTGRNVNGLRNTVSLLVETRGVGLGRLHFLRRVHTQVVAAQSVLSSAAARADDLPRLRQFVEQEVASAACQGDVVVEAGPTPSEKSLLMLDPVTGADKRVDVAWDSALELRVRRTRARPCGYWLAPDQTDAVTRLRSLGITVQQFGQNAAVRGETFRETAREEVARADVRGTIADAALVQKVSVETVPAVVDAPAGSYFVPLAQPLAALVVAAMEPDTQNSYFANRVVTRLAGSARLMALPEGRLSDLP